MNCGIFMQWSTPQQLKGTVYKETNNTDRLPLLFLLSLPHSLSPSFLHLYSSLPLCFIPKECNLGSSHHGTAETNPTRNHEVLGSIPALAQWVKDLMLP